MFSEIKVLLADNPPGLQDTVRNLIQFQDDMEVVGEVGSPVETLLGVKTINADVVIITLFDPKEEPGIVSHLLAEYPKLLVIAISPTFDIANLYRQSTSKEAVSSVSNEKLLKMIRTVRAGDES